MAKFRMRKVLPKLIVKHKTFSPKELREKLLLEHNVERTSESITMFFKRHPEILEQCKREIGQEDAQHETIRYEFDYWIDKNLRSQISIVQDWIDALLARKASKKVIRREVGRLRCICMGIKARGKKSEETGKIETNVPIIDWKIHPLGLNEKRAQKYIAEIVRQGFDDFPVRLTIRNFLKFGKGEEPRQISGAKPRAKYGHINASKEKCNKILEWIRQRDYRIYAYCLFLNKTGTRAQAGKVAFSDSIRDERMITVWDKGKKGEKYRWDKHIDDELLYALEPLLEEEELFENIDLKKAYALCREAYQIFLPKIAKEISVRPLHFWRHIFAQHMLRQTEWNHSLVAILGGWKSAQTLKDNYGMPSKEEVLKMGMKYIPMI